MGRMLKGVLLGGAVGALVAVAQSKQRGEPDEQLAQRAVKGAAEAALVGGLVGLVLDRRARAKARKAAAAAPAILQYARKAKPVVDTALDLVLDAAEAARPRVEQAAVAARKRAEPLVDAARPRLEQTADRVRERAAELAEATARHLAVETDGEGQPRQVVLTLA